MPIHEIKAPNGDILEIEAPANASPELIIKFAMKNYQPSQPKPPKRGFFDNALDVAKDTAAQTGRMVVGGATGLAGIVANPLNATINMAGEALGYNPNLSTDIRGQALQQYDTAVGDRGKPTDAMGRIIQAGGEALIGGGLVSGAAKLAKAPAAISEIFGINNVPSALAEVGAGAGAQTGMEVAPENPILSQLIGGVTGAIAPQAIANAPRGIAKGLGVNPEKVTTLEQARMPLNMPAVSDSNAIRGMSSASQNVIGGGKLKQSMDAAYKQAEKSLRDLGYTGTTSIEQAGEQIKGGLINWRNQKKSAFNDMDKTFDNFVSPLTQVDNDVFVNTIDNSINKIATSEGLTGQQIADRLSHPALQQLKSLSDAAKAGEPITLNALNEARKKIGELTAKSPLTPNFDSVITNQAYETLHQIRRETAKAVGGEQAVKLLDDKNTFYKKYIDEEKSFNAKLVKKLGDAPEAIFQQLMTNSKVGASNAKRTLARLNEPERDAFRDALIYQLGGKDDFSIGRWANAYNQMSKEAKSAFFMGKPALQQAHDDLMQGVNVYKELGQFKNTSNTAAHNVFMNLLSGFGFSTAGSALGGVTGAISAIPAGYSINKLFASVMASPKATKMLANSLKNPPASENILRNSLIKTLKASGYTDNTAQQEIDKLLEEATKPLPQPAFETPNNPQNAPIPREPLTLDITPQSNNFTMQNEGLRMSAYTDTTGNPSIGYGFNFNSGIAPRVWKEAGVTTPYKLAKTGKATITPQEAVALYQTSKKIAINDARNFYPDFDKLSPKRQMALADMSYQLGSNKLKEFGGLKKALKTNNKNAIIKHIKGSQYYSQTPNRAKEVLNLLIAED